MRPRGTARSSGSLPVGPRGIGMRRPPVRRRSSYSAPTSPIPPMEFLEGSEPLARISTSATRSRRGWTNGGVYSNIGFDGIVAALLGHHCEAIISSMNNTPERAEQVDFVNYLYVGQSLIVPKGNPLSLSTLESLCGHASAAQVGTTNLDALNVASEECVAAGKEPIDIVGLPRQYGRVLALKADRVDAVETDSPVAAYYVAQDPETFELGEAAIDPLPSVSLSARTTRSCAIKSRRRSMRCTPTAR